MNSERVNVAPLMLVAVGVVLTQLVFAGLVLVVEPPLATDTVRAGVDGDAIELPAIVVLMATPVVSVVVAGLFWMVLRLEPRQAHLGQSSPAVLWIMASGLVFLVALHIVIIATVIGAPLHVGVVISMLVGALFATVGLILPRLRSNWALGVRTPWTLTSESSWRRTQRLARAMFVVGGLLIAGVGIASDGRLVGLTVVATVVTVGLTLVAYSYVQWRKDPDRRWFGS